MGQNECLFIKSSNGIFEGFHFCFLVRCFCLEYGFHSHLLRFQTTGFIEFHGGLV